MVDNIKRDPFEMARPARTRQGTHAWHWVARLPGSVTAYLYDWNIIPIGQMLWLKELESYKAYPPMQDPESYNLDQVLQQVKEQRGISHAGD